MLNSKQEKRRQAKQELLAALFFLGGIITGGMIEKIDKQNKQKETIYQLTWQDKTHYCRLENDVYYDIFNKDMIAISGYEKELGYNVIPLIVPENETIQNKEISIDKPKEKIR